MSKASTQTNFISGFNIKFGGNLASTIRWVEWLSSPEFNIEIIKRWKLPSHLTRLVKIARSVINEQIYSVGYNERNIERSVTAVFAEAGATLYLDPAIAPAKGPMEGMDPSQVNYAAFFERTEFNSFIMGSGVDVYHPLKHRPFFDAMTLAFKEEEERQYQRAIYAAMKSKIPRTQS